MGKTFISFIFDYTEENPPKEIFEEGYNGFVLVDEKGLRHKYSSFAEACSAIPKHYPSKFNNGVVVEPNKNTVVTRSNSDDYDRHRCGECGEYNCDGEGVGHYRG